VKHDAEKRIRTHIDLESSPAPGTIGDTGGVVILSDGKNVRETNYPLNLFLMQKKDCLGRSRMGRQGVSIGIIVPVIKPVS
jgi:hypothetical protein